MLTYITRAEHEAAGDYSTPVKIRGHYYRISVPPVFEELRDTATIEAELMPINPSRAPSKFPSRGAFARRQSMAC